MWLVIDGKHHLDFCCGPRCVQFSELNFLPAAIAAPNARQILLDLALRVAGKVVPGHVVLLTESAALPEDVKPCL